MSPDPTFWQLVESHVPTVGWSLVGACAVFCLRLAWRARGHLDHYVTQQQVAHDLATKTLAEVEAAKQTALTTVAEAQAHGAAKANEILQQVGELNNNHLGHIETGIQTLNDTQERLIDMQKRHLEVASDMKESLAILRDRSSRGRK
jgi:hypothetical protein